MRLHRWILAAASWLVPKTSRAEWRAEWEAELHHREAAAEPWTGRRRQRRLDLISRTTGAFWDALWLQSSRWYSLRLFGRHWRLALAAVLSLSVAIAATVMGFSAYNALLLRPPGVGDPGSLRLIHIRTSQDPFGDASFPEYAFYRDGTRAFSGIAAFPFSISSVKFSDGDRTEQVVVTQVSNNFFQVLDIKPRLGTLVLRGSPANDVHDIVVSNGLWRRLGADSRLVGRTVKLNDQPVTVAGVAPPTFGGMTWGFDPDVWMALRTSEPVLGNSPTQMTDRNLRWLHMVGRLRPGFTTAQAAAEAQLLAAAVEKEHPETEKGRSAVLTPVSVTPPGDRGWATMILGSLVLIVLLTLVVACANVTNLLLGLSNSRRHEMLVRAALGATRLQLALPPLRESVGLGVVSGLLGYGAAWAALTKLMTFKPSLGAFLPAPTLNLTPDAFVLAATMVTSLVAGLAVGLAPALRGASEGLAGGINRELAIAEPRKARIRSTIVVIQMAVATVVLVGVGLSIHSLVNLKHVALGFSARNLVFAGVNMRRSGFDEKTGPAFYERIRSRLPGARGIEAVTIANDVPLLGYSSDHVVAEGAAPPPDGHGAETPYGVVDDRYFSTLGIKLLSGRTFDARDRSTSTEVVVINATLARRHWPGQNPIGHRLRIENGNRLVEVIGVVPDGKYGDIGEDQLQFMYFALSQHYLPDITVIARTNGPRDTVALALLDLDPDVAFGGVGLMTLDDVLRVSLLLPEIIVWTIVSFGILAVALAALGLYSTIFYSVNQRRMEIGIRMALGAKPVHLFTMVLRQTGWVAFAGALVGLLAGFALLPAASSILYGIGPVEPAVLVSVALGSVAIALGTTYLVIRPWTRLTAIDLLRR